MYLFHDNPLESDTRDCYFQIKSGKKEAEVWADPHLALQYMINLAKNQQGFDVDSSQGAAEALVRLVAESTPEGLESLCAIFFTSKDPLALTLSAYQVVQEAARAQRLEDPDDAQKLLETADVLASMASGLINVFSKVRT